MKFLYLCVSGDWLKFGIATNIKKRISCYKTHNPNFDFHLIWQGVEQDIDQFESAALTLLNGLERKSDWARLNTKSLKLKSIIDLLDSRFERYSHKERDLFTEWVSFLTPLIDKNAKFIKRDNLMSKLDKLGYLNYELKTGKVFEKAISHFGFYRTAFGFKKRQTS